MTGYGRCAKQSQESVLCAYSCAAEVLLVVVLAQFQTNNFQISKLRAFQISNLKPAF